MKNRARVLLLLLLLLLTMIDAERSQSCEKAAGRGAAAMLT
jgi:hypothetical protein